MLFRHHEVLGERWSGCFFARSVSKQAAPSAAQQPDATQSVVGDWVKNGGAVVTLNADGSMKSTDGDGTWQWTKKEKLQFAVNHRRGSSYTLTLSADGTRAVGEVDKGDPGKIGKRIEMVRKLSAPAVAANPAPAPATQPPAAAETNLLKNGAFENGMDGWNFDNHRKQATATRDVAELHTGHPSIRIDNQEPVDSFLVQTVTLKPSTRYRLSGWVKAKNVVKPEGQRDGPAGACLAIIGGYTQNGKVVARRRGLAPEGLRGFRDRNNDRTQTRAALGILRQAGHRHGLVRGPLPR